MHICRNASSDTCRWMPKLFKPLKIEIAIEALGNNTLVKAKVGGAQWTGCPPTRWLGAAMNICCNAFSDTCRRMPKLIRPLKSEIAIETLRSNTLVKAKSWGGGPINRVPPQPADWGGPGPPRPPPPLPPPMVEWYCSLIVKKVSSHLLCKSQKNYFEK